MCRRSVAFLTFRDPSIRRESIDVLHSAPNISKATSIDNHTGLNGYIGDGTGTRRTPCLSPGDVGDRGMLPTTSTFPRASQNLGRLVNVPEAPSASTPNGEAAGMTEGKHRLGGAHTGLDQALEDEKVGGGTTSSEGCGSDYQHGRIDFTAAGSRSTAFNVINSGIDRGGAVNSRASLTGAKLTSGPRCSKRFSLIPGQRDLRDSAPGDEDAPRIEEALDFFAGGGGSGGPEGWLGGGVCRASSV